MEFTAPTNPVCAIDGAPIVVPEGSIGTGYAMLEDGRIVCYRHVDEMERAEIAALESGKPFGAYLSSDGRSVITWSGGELARVTRETTSRSGWHASTITYVRAVSPSGKRFYGKGAGRGMFLTLRATKQ